MCGPNAGEALGLGFDHRTKVVAAVGALLLKVEPGRRKKGSGSLLPLSKVSPFPFLTQGTSARLRCHKLGSASSFSRASVRNSTKMGQSTLAVRFPLRCLQGELLPAIR
jgi:hypothetical protein